MSLGHSEDMSFISGFEEASSSPLSWPDNGFSYTRTNGVEQPQAWNPNGQVMQPLQFTQHLNPVTNGGFQSNPATPQQHFKADYPVWTDHQQNIFGSVCTGHQEVPQPQPQSLVTQQFNQNQYFSDAGNAAYYPAQNQQWNMNIQQFSYETNNTQMMPQTRNNLPNLDNGSPVMHIQITQMPKRKLVRTTKKKRHRTAFTTDQVLALEEVFKKQTYVSRDERVELHRKLGISDRAIKVWFQNRRMKGKREYLEEESDDSSDVSELRVPMYQCPQPSLPCPQIEPVSSTSHDMEVLQEKLNETPSSDIVTLDGNVLTSLLNVIDARISQDVQLTDSDVNVSPGSSTESMMKYEPISPAGSTWEDNDFDNTQWSPPTDKEALQQLFEKHFC